jgi:hypothetical protein
LFFSPVSSVLQQHHLSFIGSFYTILHSLCVCVNDNIGTNHWHDGSFLRFGCFCLLLLLYLPVTTVFRV